MIPIPRSVRPLRCKMVKLVQLLVLMLTMILATGSIAHAHPLDAACLADTSKTPAHCQAAHDERDKAGLDKALDRLKSMQGNFPASAAPHAASYTQTIKRFLELGFIHIVPRGLDHILFVLALFLGVRTWQQLLAQVSAFTLAHSVTLGLAVVSIISVPANIVEPIIALSITFLALENVFAKAPLVAAKAWLLSSRVLVVFAFGLFHGLGFAGVLSELGFDQGRFFTSLIAFNLGVEGGQLAVIAIAAVPALLLRRVLVSNGVPHLYGQILVKPVSVLISVAGLWWAFERIFLGG
jgi:HupE / UreJ protein